MSHQQEIAKFIQNISDGNYAAAETHLVEAADEKAMNSINQENLMQALMTESAFPRGGDETASIMNTIIAKLQQGGKFVQDIDLIKNTALEIIKPSKINPKTKMKMVMAIQGTNTANKLYQYIYNSLLKHQGQGVIQTGDQY